MFIRFKALVIYIKTHILLPLKNISAFYIEMN